MGDKRKRESDEESDGRKIEKRRKTIDSGRRNLENDVVPPPLRLGVATWNVAHFGEGALTMLKQMRAAWRACEELATRDAGTVTNEFAKYACAYGAWILNIKTACQPAVEVEPEWIKLCTTRKRHKGIGRKRKTTREPSEDDDDDEDSEPEELAAALCETWKVFDGEAGAALMDTSGIWKAYFEAAFNNLASAWEQFSKLWAELGGCEDEDAADHLLDEKLMWLAPALKELRLGTKMIVKPLLELREQVNLAKAVQTWAEKQIPKEVTDKDNDWVRRVEEAGRCLSTAQGASRWTHLTSAYNRAVDLDKVIHKMLVARQIVNMFENNQWLDVLILQEVNKGIDALEEYLDEHGLECIRGVKLRSISGKGSQTEYYPLIVRKFSFRVRTIDGMYGLFNDGSHYETTTDILKSPELTWDKKNKEYKEYKTYRPVLLYEISVRTSWDRFEQVWVGVVHTSPAGSEFDRPDVFEQVDTPLRRLSGSSIPVIVGGDFYLTAEAVTRKLGDLSKSEKALAISEKKRQEKALAKILKTTKKDLRAARRDGKDDTKVKELEKRVEKIVEIKESLNSRKIQLIRNDESVCLSVRKRIEKYGLDVHQPLTGTNWKTREVNCWFDAQIADFFVASGPRSRARPIWEKSRTGIVNPLGGISDADTETMDLAKFWRCCSDHFPVGALFSSRSSDDWVDEPFAEAEAWSIGEVEVGARSAPPPTEPHRVLGLLNTGNQCYVNAALQLIARIDLDAHYVQPNGAFRPAGAKKIRTRVGEILQTRATEGATPSYLSYGSHRYTTASTFRLRKRLVKCGAARSVKTQEDSGEALTAILAGFDKVCEGFNPGSQASLVDNIDNFVNVRPSKLHFLLRTTTTYELADMEEEELEDVVVLDKHDKHVSHRVDNMLRINLPDDDDEELEENVLDMGELLTATLRHQYGDDEDFVPVETSSHSYRYARRTSESVELVVEPEDWLVILNRFYTEWVVVEGQREAHARKRNARVDVAPFFNGHPLRAFIVHVGDSAFSGHYIAYVHDRDRDDEDARWWCIDDTRVTAADDDEIAEQLPHAYVLYYTSS